MVHTSMLQRQLPFLCRSLWMAEVHVRNNQALSTSAIQCNTHGTTMSEPQHNSPNISDPLHANPSNLSDSLHTTNTPNASEQLPPHSAPSSSSHLATVASNKTQPTPSYSYAHPP